MREIKFRAWDKANKKLMKVLTLTWWNTIISLVDNDNNTHEVHHDNAELMQFTGLKDGNEKEIYEGDIVSWQDSTTDLEGKIEWSDGDTAFIFKSERGQAFLNQEYMDNFVVIGNIYEDPDLNK